MLDEPKRRHERSAGRIEYPDFASILIKPKRALRLAAWLACLAILLPLAGCGGSSAKKKDAAAVAEAESAQEEAKEKPAAEAPAPRAKKRGSKLKINSKAPEKAAVSPPPAASTKDFTKWNAADMDAAIARKDLLFIPAVITYSAGGPEDAKRAAELDDLVHKVGRMKDDPTIPLALPAGAYAAAAQQAGGSTAEPSATAAPSAPSKKLHFNFGIGK